MSLEEPRKLNMRLLLGWLGERRIFANSLFSPRMSLSTVQWEDNKKFMSDITCHPQRSILCLRVPKCLCSFLRILPYFFAGHPRVCQNSCLQSMPSVIKIIIWLFCRSKSILQIHPMCLDVGLAKRNMHFFSDAADIKY